MKVVVRHLVVAVVLGVIAAVVLAGGLVQAQIADAERELATLNVNRAALLFDQVQDRLAVTEGITWLLPGTKDELEARQAAARYWRGEYAALVDEYPDLGRPDIRSNVPLQLTLASAYVRAGELAADGDRVLTLGELDRAISIYLQVLQNTSGNRDAAYNYEYLVRLRAELADGAEVPPRRPPGPLGRPGDEEEMEMEDDGETKVYVPADRLLNRDAVDEPTLGSDAPLRRRG